MQEAIAWKYSSTFALPLTYSSMLLLMLLSICSSDMAGIVGVGAIIVAGTATLAVLIGAAEGGGPMFGGLGLFGGGPPIEDENIGAGVLR